MRKNQFVHDPANEPVLPHSCKCGRRWSGLSTCHCSVCHVTFGGYTNFDRHRNNGKCLTPESIGLSLIPGRTTEVYGAVDDEVGD